MDRCVAYTHQDSVHCPDANTYRIRFATQVDPLNKLRRLDIHQFQQIANLMSLRGGEFPLKQSQAKRNQETTVNWEIASLRSQRHDENCDLLSSVFSLHSCKADQYASELNTDRGRYRGQYVGEEKFQRTGFVIGFASSGAHVALILRERGCLPV